MTPLPAVEVGRRYWRVLSPRWSPQPLSGEGAARRGGRFNPPGVPALYMSEGFETAVAEYQQDLGVRPATLCAYEVEADAVLDLTDEATRRAALTSLDELASPWKQIALAQGGRPPTWTLVERLLSGGIVGIRVPSVQVRGRVNLVLWRWNGDAPSARVRVLDPLGEQRSRGGS